MATPTINFDSPFKLLNAAKDKPDAGTNWYKHRDTKYECLYLGVGKRWATWYFKGRIAGKSKHVKLGTFPEMSPADALAQIDTESRHRGNTATASIKTVRDAWNEYKAGSGATEQHMSDQTSKLERYAPNILNMSPTQVGLLDVRRCLNAIPSIATRHHVKAGINSAFSFLDIPSPIPRGKLKAKQIGKVGKRDTFWKVLCDGNDDIDRRDWSPMWEAIMSVKNPLRRAAWIVMLFTGIRSNDVRSLCWEQVNLQRAEIKLTELKNGETRTIPVCQTVVKALQAIRSSKYDQVFPAVSKTGYLDHLDTLMHPTLKVDTGESDKNGNAIFKPVHVLRQHDTRHHFSSACGPARIPSYAVAFLRGDITSKNSDDEMAMHYQEDLDMHALVADIERVLIERIKTTPYSDG